MALERENQDGAENLGQVRRTHLFRCEDEEIRADAQWTQAFRDVARCVGLLR